MEIRIRSFFLALVFVLPALPLEAAVAQSNEDDATGLIEPQIERTEFDEALIDSSDFEIAAYTGYLAVDNFNTDFVTGIKLGYHVSEDFFVQASYGRGEVGETSYERLSGGAPLLSKKEREVEYYLIVLGFNLFPGEAFVTDSTTFNTVFYISGGVGTTTFAGDDRFTIAYAVGHRTLFADGFSLDIEMRDLIFEQDIFGTEEATNNLEFTVSLNLYF
ncbi:MAG TPA: outer membrane beta-barrel domain-containing protein [Gammaproteobacteria bacterium]|nr:outer membrane beta-barrel domain-containing protein [Gammaproteobacteria bacterium]